MMTSERARREWLGLAGGSGGPSSSMWLGEHDGLALLAANASNASGVVSAAAPAPARNLSALLLGSTVEHVAAAAPTLLPRHGWSLD